ncbi:MAG TPA: isoprenylcysteine carboxylmethyltransferase family protein [Tepidisphaeraceae bacterium]|nr:isoprenylcysteine carboxylmethyltransferase family protein [Tepidisphaeraceae bacterium]
MNTARSESCTLAHPLHRGWKVFLVAASLLFSLGYVALAVIAWGWRDWVGFFDGAPRSFVCLGMIVLFVGTFLFGCNVSTGRHDRPRNNWIFLPMFLVGLAMGWLPPYDDRRNIWTLAGHWAPYFGMLAFFAGTVLRIGAVRTLGPRHSVWVAVQEDHHLTTTGLYRFIRHPSYLGALLAVFGWALAFRSVAGLALGTLMIPPIVSRMAAEEEMLIAEFGSPYREYQRRTRRILPGLY